MILPLLLAALSFQAPRNDSRANRELPFATPERGTDSLPISVKLLKTGEEQTTAKQNAEHMLREEANARINVLLTAALVAATVVSLGVLGYQSKWLKRSVTQAETAARADLRAYVNVDKAEIRADSGKITLTNNGKTPAHNLREWIHIYHGPKSRWKLEPNTFGVERPGALSLPAGHSRTVPYTVPALTASEQIEVARGDPAWMYVHGLIAYTDVFDRECSVEYCFDVGTDTNAIGRANRTEGYNKET